MCPRCGTTYTGTAEEHRCSALFCTCEVREANADLTRPGQTVGWFCSHHGPRTYKAVKRVEIWPRKGPDGA